MDSRPLEFHRQLTVRKNTAINNFTGGEWTPFLDGRADLQKYESACIRMENFRPLPWGGATYRPGTEFIGLAKYPDRKCRLIPFNYSTALSYVIELGDGYMRFWNSNGTAVNVTIASLPVFSNITAYSPGTFVQFSGAAYYCIGAVPAQTPPASNPTPDTDSTNWSAQNQYEIITPYTTAQLFGVQFKQINAQVRFVHPAVPPQTLTFSGASTGWSIASTAFKYPVLRDQNAVQTSTLSVAALTGSTTLTASVAGTFNTQHVGSYWELQHLREASSVALDMDNQTIGVQVFSSSIQMEGDWTFTTSQFWYGHVQVQRSIDGGSTWTVIRDFTGKSDQNYSTSGTELAPDIGFPAVLYRVAYTQAGAPFSGAVWVGTAPSQYAFAQATLESQDAYIAGLVLVTAFIDTQNVTVTVILAPVSTAATYLWSEGAFSTYRGFPQCIAFYEQRLLYSGTTNQPNTVWGSVTGDFDNFQYSDSDDAAVAFQPAVCQQNQVVWLATLLRVHAGTTGEEIIMASGNLDEPLTPSNITIRAQSYYGSTPIQPVLIQNSILFVERNGLRVREMRELSPYVVPTDFVAPDLTLMSEHITQPGILAMDFARLPDPLAYFIRADGQMPVMTYNREQNVTAWARYVTAGSFESIACIYGSPADEVWVSVARQIGTGLSTVRTIESFTSDPASSASLTLNLLLDCGTLVQHGGAPTTSLSGLTWLKGVNVTAVIDGAAYKNLTVNNAGVLTFPPNVTCTSTVSVGIPYGGVLAPMKPELVDQEGTSQGKKRRITEIVLRVRNSVAVRYAGGPNPTNYRLMQFRSPGDAVGSMTPLSSTTQAGTANPNGIADWPLPGPWPDGNSFEGQINLLQEDPFPLTILGIFTKFDIL